MRLGNLDEMIMERHSEYFEVTLWMGRSSEARYVRVMYEAQVCNIASTFVDSLTERRNQSATGEDRGRFGEVEVIILIMRQSPLVS